VPGAKFRDVKFDGLARRLAPTRAVPVSALVAVAAFLAHAFLLLLLLPVAAAAPLMGLDTAVQAVVGAGAGVHALRLSADAGGLVAAGIDEEDLRHQRVGRLRGADALAARAPAEATIRTPAAIGRSNARIGMAISCQARVRKCHAPRVLLV
jgi:hypothetical protein